MADKNILEEYKKKYNHLNPEQRQAVDTLEGPVLVLAGPGTGKTQVLTMRIANILLKTDTNPSSILALTFTESGVRAMKERLISIVGTQAYKVHIHTFHSFASSLIQHNLDYFELPEELEPLSDLERVYIFREIFDEANFKILKPFNAPYLYLDAASRKIEELKREGINPSEFIELVNNAEFKDKRDKEKNIELQQVYEAYESKLKQHKRYDFQDMISFVTNKFKSNKEFLQKIQEQFEYFLVDEFQDTNSSQAELLYQLSSYWGANANLFVVGDDDQSVFRFQGASLENILDFNDKYPNSAKIILKTNYRSIQPILNAAHDLIKNNTNRVDKKLQLTKTQKSAHKTPSESVAIKTSIFSSSYTENHFIAMKIKELIDNKVEPGNIAVIYRHNSDSKDISDMLARMDIEYEIFGGENVLESGIIIRLLHLLRTIHKISLAEEDMDLFTLFNYEFLDFNKLDILKLARFATRRKINLFDALTHSEIKKSEIEELDKIIDFRDKLNEWSTFEANNTTIDFIEHVIKDSNYLNWILEKKANYEFLNKLNSFLSEVKKLNLSDKKLTLKKLLDYIELMEQNRIQIREESIELNHNTVKLMTAHKAKGLEYEYVFIPKFIDKKWNDAVEKNLIKLPTNLLKTLDQANEKIFKQEDERRLVYVAITRATTEVFITSANIYDRDGNTKEAIPSSFLFEIEEKNKEDIETEKYESSASEILKTLMQNGKPVEVIEPNENEFLQATLKNFRLSPTALNTYMECGYKFKLDTLFNTPKPKEKYFVLGSAVHNALEQAYRRMTRFKQPVSVKFLHEHFINALEKEILTESDFDQTAQRGKNILETYYEKYENEFSNPESHNILFIETLLGKGFSNPMLDGKIPLRGKIDKGTILDNQSKTIKITDYKTGKPKSRNEILGNTQSSDKKQYIQLLFYKLLVELDYTIKYTVNQVELDYIGDEKSKPKRESFEINESEIEDLKNIIRKNYENIKNLKFQRTTDYSVCMKCPFLHHCYPDGKPTAHSEQIGMEV